MDQAFLYACRRTDSVTTDGGGPGILVHVSED